MTANNLPLLHSYKPASFLERGVAVPFTTPQLAGARVRPAERTGTEFVVPNPSGGRGVYVLHWGGVRQLCRPTVHDTLLHQRIARLPVMDPRGVRLTVRGLAAEGMAGREAAASAAAAAEADRQEHILLNFLLLVTLMEQIEPSGPRIGAATERTPDLDRRARRVVGGFAASINRGMEQVSTDLEALSGLYISIGLDPAGAPPRLPRLAARLGAAAQTLQAWAGSQPDDSFAPLAISIAKSAHVTAACAARTVQSTRALAHDMPGLLRGWSLTPDEIRDQASRPAWVLDGWERICLLWETADHPSKQRAVLLEIAQLVPLLPREVSGWGDQEQSELENLESAFRGTRLNDQWRNGAASFSLVARNEQIQSLIE